MNNKNTLLIISGAVLVVLITAFSLLQLAKQPTAIEQEEITSEYFSGSISHITGSSAAAKAAEAYLHERFEAFEAQANTDVPALREQFGENAPSGTYEIHLTASVIEGADTESIVIEQYEYTGGANGMSSYKTFTSPKKGGKVLALSDVIAAGQEEVFTQEVRTRLTRWESENEGVSLFAEDVATLTFDFFSNWSLSGDTLTVYFDKYAVGPGVIGALALPIPLTEIESMLAR